MKRLSDIKTRENGFYWVKDNRGSDWYIAEWIDDSWYVCGLDCPIRDKNFRDVDEKRITREKTNEFPNDEL